MKTEGSVRWTQETDIKWIKGKKYFNNVRIMIELMK